MPYALFMSRKMKINIHKQQQQQKSNKTEHKEPNADTKNINSENTRKTAQQNNQLLNKVGFFKWNYQNQCARDRG